MDLPQIESHPDPAEQRLRDSRRFRGAALLATAFVAVLWWIRLFEHVFGDFSALALRPREAFGAIGILTAPLLHASFAHLLSNSLPLLILITLSLAVVPRAAQRAFVLIWLGSGVGVWWLARDSAHLGASGLAHGLMFFVFAIGLLRRERAAIAAALIAFFLYGGMVLTVLPGDPQVSWETHLGGALAGVLAALLWYRRDPAPARKRYSWEDEEEAEAAHADADPLEPARPERVPVLWQRQAPSRGQVLPFPVRRPPDDDAR